MQSENNYRVIRLFDLMAMDGGEDFFKSIANSFESKNSDVEDFFKQKAIQAMKLKTASTYLVFSFENGLFDFLGYFTLATKMLSLKRESLSKRECKEIERYSYFDNESKSYKLPAILIAQFSRNFHTDSESISGFELMNVAIDRINDILNMTSGKAVFLECEQNIKIIDFYKANRFNPLDEVVISRNNKQLIQMYRIL